MRDSFPVYKDTAKKALAFIMHFEKHAVKNPKQRIDQYCEILAGGLTKFLKFVIGRKTEETKKSSLAE